MRLKSLILAGVLASCASSGRKGAKCPPWISENRCGRFERQLFVPELDLRLTLSDTNEKYLAWFSERRYVNSLLYSFTVSNLSLRVSIELFNFWPNEKRSAFKIAEGLEKKFRRMGAQQLVIEPKDDAAPLVGLSYQHDGVDKLLVVGRVAGAEAAIAFRVALPADKEAREDVIKEIKRLAQSAENIK